MAVDTQLLWRAAAGPDRLPAAVRGELKDMGNDLMFSAASTHEVFLEDGLGRKVLAVDAALLWRRGLPDDYYAELPIAGQHAVQVGRLTTAAQGLLRLNPCCTIPC